MIIRLIFAIIAVVLLSVLIVLIGEAIKSLSKHDTINAGCFGTKHIG